MWGRGSFGVGVDLGVVLAALVFLAAPAHAADPVIVAGGDVACNPFNNAKFNDGGGTLVPAPGECHQRYTSDLFAGLKPLHLLALGDLQYEDGRRAGFDASYAPSWGRFKTITKPVPGNHEYGAGNANFDATAAGYFGYFGGELAAEGPDAGDPKKGWYSFDVPVDGGSSWHIVALNSECASGLRAKVGWDGGCDAGSEQEQWLRQDLAANKSDCTIAYWHHPLYSSGGEGPSPVMAPIWNALHDDYADLVLNGHDHDYERFPPRGSAPEGTPEPGRGLREIVVGTGGKSLLASGTKDSTREVFQNTNYGVLKLTLHGAAVAHPVGWYEWEFIDDGKSGTPFEDKGSADCVSPPRTPAPNPGSGSGSGAGSSPGSSSPPENANGLSPGPAAGTPPAGSGAPLAGTAPDTVAPFLLGARLTHRRFRVGSSSTARSAASKAPLGTAATYALSEAATTTLTIDRRLPGRAVRLAGRKGRRCVRQSKSNAKRANPRCIVHRRAAALERRQRAGRQTVKLSGRFGRAKLAVGSYRLTLAAEDLAGNTSTRTALTFTVVRR